jgi:hypothetical protein
VRSSEVRLGQLKECREFALKEFPAENSIVKQLDKIHYEMLQKTGQVTSQTDAQKANYALGILSYRTLHCALDNLEEGYYEIAMTLLRRVYEIYVQMSYFAKFPDDAKKWWEEDKKFDQKSMRDKLGMKSTAYAMLSTSYAHTLKVESIASVIFDNKEGKLSMNHYPVYSHHACKMCLLSSIVFSHNTLIQYQQVFRADQIVDKHWMGQVGRIQKLVNAFIEEAKYDNIKEREAIGTATETQQ